MTSRFPAAVRPHQPSGTLSSTPALHTSAANSREPNMFSWDKRNRAHVNTEQFSLTEATNVTWFWYLLKSHHLCVESRTAHLKQAASAIHRQVLHGNAYEEKLWEQVSRRNNKHVTYPGINTWHTLASASRLAELWAAMVLSARHLAFVLSWNTQTPLIQIRQG